MNELYRRCQILFSKSKKILTGNSQRKKHKCPVTIGKMVKFTNCQGNAKETKTKQNNNLDYQRRKRLITPSAGQDTCNWHSHTRLVGLLVLQLLLQAKLLLKCKMYLFFDPEISFLGIYLTETKVQQFVTESFQQQFLSKPTNSKQIKTFLEIWSMWESIKL